MLQSPFLLVGISFDQQDIGDEWLMVASPKQVGCVSGRNSEIRAAEVLDHREVDSDHFPFAVKSGPPEPPDVVAAS